MKRGGAFGSPGWVAVATLLVALSAARAQTPVPQGVLEFEDAEIFRPTTDGGDFLTVYDSDALPRGIFHLGFYGDYARNPIEIQFVRSGDTFTRVVEDLGTMQLSGAIGVLPRFSIGARVPGYVSSLEEVLADGRSFGGTEADLGDITLNGKLNLLDRRDFAIGLAILPEVTLPTGNRRDFAGTGKLGGGGFLVLDTEATPDLVLAANFGGFIRDEIGGGPFKDPDDAFNDQFRYGVAGAYRFATRWTAITELYGGADTSDPFNKERKTPLDLVGAFRWNAGPVDVTFGGGAGLTRGQGSPDFRLFAGVTTPKPDYTRRPGEADLSQSAKTYNMIDRDRDGRTSPGDVLEYQINVVNTGEVEATNVVVEDPIPDRTRYIPGSLRIDGRPMTDAVDGDGGEVLTDPPARVVFRLPRLEGGGVGESAAVLTFQVEIDPNIVEMITVVNQATVEAAQVPRFPLPPSSTTIFPAITERERVIVGPDKIELTEEIHFEFDKSTIRRESWPILKELADVLMQYPDLRVRIDGHTDSTGSESYNQALSERRALAVRDFLVGLGIPKERLEWAGYGESKPIASNETAMGRAKNRRTEFPVLNPEALRHKVIERREFHEDLAPESEPDWLRRRSPRE